MTAFGKVSGSKIWGNVLQCLEFGSGPSTELPTSKASGGRATGASPSPGLPVPGPGSEVMFCKKLPQLSNSEVPAGTFFHRRKNGALGERVVAERGPSGSAWTWAQLSFPCAGRTSHPVG